MLNDIFLIGYHAIIFVLGITMIATPLYFNKTILSSKSQLATPERLFVCALLPILFFYGIYLVISQFH